MTLLVQLPNIIFIYLKFLNFSYVNVPVTYLLILRLYVPEEGLFSKPKYRAIFCYIHFLLYVFRLLCLSLTAVRISRSVYFFTSNVLLIQVFLRSGNCQRLVAVLWSGKFVDFDNYSTVYS